MTKPLNELTSRQEKPAQIKDDSPYHAGELIVQTLSGVEEQADFLGRRMFRAYMPDQHREFFSHLPFVLIGSVDDTGQPWASMLIGAPGFAHSPDPHTLAIDAQAVERDPLARALQPGAALGVLGIELHTRRRNRLNGRVRELTPQGFVIEVDQSFGNCPKYISARTPERTQRTAAGASRAEGAQLSDAAIACVTAADTCFLASASASEFAPGDTREGADVSHRGGKPGFVHVEQRDGATRLLMPDFPGNNAFNTLGNLVRYPRAGLLFPDFSSGDLLSLACSAEILWEGPELARFRGAERIVAFTVHSGLYFQHAMPFQWTEPLPGPHVEKTGSW